MLLSRAIKFEISIFFGIPTDFKVSHSSFGFPIYSEILSPKIACFYAVINFNVFYFAFLYRYLSIWSLDFLNVLKSLSLVFIFFKTSPSWYLVWLFWPNMVQYCQWLSKCFFFWINLNIPHLRDEIVRCLGNWVCWGHFCKHQQCTF